MKDNKDGPDVESDVISQIYIKEGQSMQQMMKQGRGVHHSDSDEFYPSDLLGAPAGGPPTHHSNLTAMPLNGSSRLQNYGQENDYGSIRQQKPLDVTKTPGNASIMNDMESMRSIVEISVEPELTKHRSKQSKDEKRLSSVRSQTRMRMSLETQEAHAGHDSFQGDNGPSTMVSPMDRVKAPNLRPPIVTKEYSLEDEDEYFPANNGQ